jgi:hypothetical protein
MGRKIFSLMILAVLAALMTVCMSCSEDIEEKTLLEIERLNARNEIQNLMGRYAYYHTSGLNFMAAQKLFTSYDDTVIEMMWGRYTGKDAAYRCFIVGHRKDDQPTITALKLDVPELTDDEKAMTGSLKASTVPSPTNVEKEVIAGDASHAASEGNASTGALPPGTNAAGADDTGKGSDLIQNTEGLTVYEGAPIHLQALTTPVIEIAGDGETARAVWTSPGLEGTEPAWVKFGCDFKKQDGEWKIWHLHVYGLVTGTEAKYIFTPNVVPSNGADKAPTTNWEYSRQAQFIPYEPEPPQTYETWDYTKIQPKSYGDPN